MKASWSVYAMSKQHVLCPWGLFEAVLDFLKTVDLLMLQIKNFGFSLNFYIQFMYYIFTYEIALFNPVNKIILSLLNITYKDNRFNFYLERSLLVWTKKQIFQVLKQY